MSEKFNTLLTGFTGVTLVEMTSTLPTAAEITHIGQICIQIAIGVVTLLRLLKSGNTPSKMDENQDKTDHPVG